MVDIAGGLRDDLAAAIAEEETLAAEAEKPEPKAEEKPVDGDIAAETPAEDPKSSKPIAGERPRGPDGKFLPADRAEATAEKPAEPAPKPAKGAAEPESVAQPEKPKADPIATATARWSAADKAMLAKLPDEAKQFLVRRHGEMEADHTKKTQAIAEFRKEYEPIDQMFAPHRQRMAQAGFTPATIVQAWSKVEQDLLDGKGAEVVAKLVQGYKIDPAAIAKAIGLNGAQPQPANGAAPNGQAPVQLDPEVQRLLAAHLEPLLDPLKKQVGEVVGFTTAQRNEIARQQAEQQERETHTANETVQNFIDATDKQGNLLHPYYSEVEAMMVVFAQADKAAGRKPNLEQIYEQAVRATPSTWEKLLAARDAAQEATRQAEARAKATAARSAAVSVTGAPTGGPAPKSRKQPESIRDALMEAAADHEDAA